MKATQLLRLGVLSAMALSAPALASGGMGMTWAKFSHGASPGVDKVGCSNCNPYTGDTACTTALPILCIRNDGSPAPSGLAIDFYNGWAKGNISTTPPVTGTKITSPAAADQLCVSYLGPNWRMAQFHDGGGGWNWYAYGNIRDDMRLWVYISDQPANCWNP